MPATWPYGRADKHRWDLRVPAGCGRRVGCQMASRGRADIGRDRDAYDDASTSAGIGAFGPSTPEAQVPKALERPAASLPGVERREAPPPERDRAVSIAGASVAGRPQSLDLRRFTCIIRYSSSSSEQFHL